LENQFEGFLSLDQKNQTCWMYGRICIFHSWIKAEAQ
jgi:hypothetical protein